MIMFLEEKVFHVYVILDVFGLYFMSSDTGTKKLFVSISNPYYKILLGEKYGKFTDNKNDELYKSIIYDSFYDIQTHFLFLGDKNLIWEKFIKYLIIN